MNSILMDALIIDWSQVSLYTSIMGISLGCGLLIIYKIISDLIGDKPLRPYGWILGLGTMSMLLFLTGLHMTLTWSLSPTFAYANLTFGEPALAAGAVMLGLTAYIYGRRKFILEGQNVQQELATDFYYYRVFLIAMGISVISMSIAAMAYNLYIAPPEEPIASVFYDSARWLTPLIVSILLGLIGLCAIVMPRLLLDMSQGNGAQSKYLWVVRLIMITGIGIVAVGILAYYAHVGMVVNTTPPDVQLVK